MTAAIIAAAVSLLVAFLVPAFTAAADRRLRKREALAKAVGALVAYREFPYVIRRRNPGDPAGERLRISAVLNSVQREIAEAAVWIAAEAPDVSKTYDEAVREHRRIAGGLMHEMWNQPGAATDEEMNVADLHERLAPLLPRDAELADLIRDAVKFRWNPFR